MRVMLGAQGHHFDGSGLHKAVRAFQGVNVWHCLTGHQPGVCGGPDVGSVHRALSASQEDSTKGTSAAGNQTKVVSVGYMGEYYFPCYGHHNALPDDEKASYVVSLCSTMFLMLQCHRTK